MNDFKIVTDSSCDIPMELIEKYDIDIVPYYVSFDGKNYYKEHLEININEFYKKLIDDNLFAKTSLPSVQDYIDIFKLNFDKQKDVLCFCLSEKFSGSYQCAVNAAQHLIDDYPERKIFIVDSTQATGAQGLIVLETANMKNAGYDIDKCFEIIEILKHTANINFTVDSLEYLRRGGRLGLVSSFLGSLLNIKPIIQLNNGELRPYSKIRGRKKAIKEVIDITFADKNINHLDYTYSIINSECLEEALEVIQEIKSKYNVDITLPITTVGVTIGCHVGPTALGISSIKRFDRL